MGVVLIVLYRVAVYWATNLLDGFTQVQTNALDGSFSISNDAGDVQGFYKITEELPSTAE